MDDQVAVRIKEAIVNKDHEGLSAVISELKQTAPEVLNAPLGETVGHRLLSRSTPLVVACSDVGSLEAVRLLVEAGVSTDVRDVDGDLPIHEAAQHNQAAIVEFLVNQCRLDVDARTSKTRAYAAGATPLFLASLFGHLEAVEMLLQLGADPRLLDTKKRTPRQVACKYVKVESASKKLELEVILKTAEAQRRQRKPRTVSPENLQEEEGDSMVIDSHEQQGSKGSSEQPKAKRQKLAKPAGKKRPQQSVGKDGGETTIGQVLGGLSWGRKRSSLPPKPEPPAPGSSTTVTSSQARAPLPALDQYVKKIEGLEADNEALRAELATEREEKVALKSELATEREEKAVLLEEKAVLQEEVAELKSRLDAVLAQI